ncbi:MAG: glycosyltransferase family 39 protein [Cyanobacteria bacterium P01_F01_bin.53]
MVLSSRTVAQHNVTGLFARLPFWLILIVLVLLALLRFCFLTADFPIGVSGPGVIYTDEGWWSRNAIAWIRDGDWYIDDGYNPIVNLPVLPLLQVLWFKAFGISLSAARGLTVVCTLAISTMVYYLARRELSPRLALLAPFLILSSYPTFAFSRLALLEMPMILLILISLRLAILKKARMATTLGSAVILTAAALTKTTALFALPMVLFFIWARPTIARHKVTHACLWLLCFGLLYGTHYVIFAQGHSLSQESYQYFSDYNVSRKLHKTLFSVLLGPLRTLRYALPLFPLLLPSLFVALFMLTRAKAYRVSLLFRVAALWSVLSLGIFSASNYAAPRYFLVLIVPIALAIPLAIQHVQSQTTHGKNRFRCLSVYRSVLMGAVSLAILMSLTRIGLYLHAPNFTFVSMASSVEHYMAQQDSPSKVIMGHFTDSMALVAPMKGFNDRMGFQPLSHRLDAFSPGYYISIGPIEKIGGERERILKQHYTLQLVETYDVYKNNDYGKPVFFYQLIPH